MSLGIGFALALGVAGSAYGCTADEGALDVPRPEPQVATVTSTPTTTPRPTTIVTVTNTPVAVAATDVPTPIVDIRLRGGEEFRARVWAALQLLTQRAPTAFERLENGIDTVYEDVSTGVDERSRTVGLDALTLFRPGFRASEQIVWLASELVRLACYGNFKLMGEGARAEEVHVACLREQAEVLQLLTDDDSEDYFRRFVRGKIDVYGTLTPSATCPTADEVAWLAELLLAESQRYRAVRRLEEELRRLAEEPDLYERESTWRDLHIAVLSWVEAVGSKYEALASPPSERTQPLAATVSELGRTLKTIETNVRRGIVDRTDDSALEVGLAALTEHAALPELLRAQIEGLCPLAGGATTP